MSIAINAQLYNSLLFSDSVTTQSINGTNKRVGGIYCAPKTGTLQYIGYQVNAFTAGGPVDIRLEGVTTGGLPDGSLVAAGASAAPSPAAVGWFWQALGTPPSVTAGQPLAPVVVFQAASALNATFGYTLSNSRQMGSPYAVSDNGTGTWGIAGNAPVVCLKYDDGTIVKGGAPLKTFATAAFASGTNPNERASVFTVPFDCEISGAFVSLFPSSRTTSDWEVNLYQGTSTSPMSGGTIACDQAVAANVAAIRTQILMFPAPVALVSGTAYRLAVKALSSGNLNLGRFTWDSTTERDFAVGDLTSDTRNGGAWIGASSTTTEMIAPILSSYTAPAAGGSHAYLLSS